MTLQELYDQHPTWRNLPIAVYTNDSQDYDYSVLAYPDTDSMRDDQGNHVQARVLVITGN
jgi:hypothetical protein